MVRSRSDSRQGAEAAGGEASYTDVSQQGLSPPGSCDVSFCSVTLEIALRSFFAVFESTLNQPCPTLHGFGSCQGPKTGTSPESQISCSSNEELWLAPIPRCPYYPRPPAS